MKRILMLIVGIFLLFNSCYAGLVSRYNTYALNGEVNSVNLNGNFDNILNELNGGLDNTNADTASGYRFFEIVGSLPASGTQGRVAFLTTTNTINFDTGSTWERAMTNTGVGANIDIGDYELRAQTLQSDVATGTAPMTIASTTKVTNLNADKVDGVDITGTTSGILMPSGAVFFMMTGSCPNGSTDVTATYADRFLRVNATQGSTGGSDTINQVVAHTHGVPINTSGGGGSSTWATQDGSNAAGITTDSTGSATVTVTNPYVTCKLCQVS